MELAIRKLTPAFVDDFFDFFEKIAFADHPEWGCECYCCFYHANSAQEWKERTAAENRTIARQMILAGSMQGLLAYADGRPVGWCHYDRKDSLPGLPVFSPEVMDSGDSAPGPALDSAPGPVPDPVGNASIGAIVCFTIAQGYRKQGIAGKLLDAACADLAAQGFDFAEAYPRPDCNSVEENYHGPLAMFLSHGFSIVKKGKEQTVVRIRVAK